MRRSLGFICTLLLAFAMLAAMPFSAYPEDKGQPDPHDAYEQSPAAALTAKLMSEYYKNMSAGDFYVDDKEAFFKPMIAIYDKVIEAFPGDPIGYEAKAQTLVQSGRAQEALELADKVASLTPGRQDGNKLKVMILSRADRHDEALALADKVIEADPKAEDMYSLLIDDLRRTKKLEEALALSDRWIKNDPDSEGAYYRRFSLLQEMKRYPEALAAVDKLIEKEPRIVSAKVRLLKEMGKTEDALIAADIEIAGSPDTEYSYIQKADLLKEMKRNDEALAVLDKALQINPGSSFILNNKIDLLQEMKRYEDAIAASDTLIAAVPEDLAGYTKKIEILKYAGRFEDIPGVLAAAVKLEPKTAEGYYSKAVTLERLDRFDDAVAAYDKGMALEAATKTDEHAIALLNRGYQTGGKLKCLIKGGRYAEALAICEGKASEKIRDIEVYKAIALEKTGRHDEAAAMAKGLKQFDSYLLTELDCPTLNLALIEARLTKDPKRRDWESYGDALVTLERFEDALTAYDNALKIKPIKDEHNDTGNPDSGIIGSRAEALLRLGRFDEAVAGYRVYAKDHGDCGCSKMSLAYALKMRSAEGDNDEAAKLLQEVVDKGDKDVRTAMAYALLGDRSKMLNLISLLVRLDPRNKKEIRGHVEFGDYRKDESFVMLTSD